MKPRKPLARRTELRSTTPLERTSRLRSSGPIKAKRPVVSPEEKLAKRIVRARSKGWCEIRLPGICVGRALDFSHRIAAGRGGKWLASNGLDACRFCHEAITNTRGHRAEFERWGYLVRTNMNTLEAPVLLACRMWALLDDDGGITEVEVRDAS